VHEVRGPGGGGASIKSVERSVRKISLSRARWARYTARLARRPRPPQHREPAGGDDPNNAVDAGDARRDGAAAAARARMTAGAGGAAGGDGAPPTLRCVDHVGFTVPDLDEAVEFFTRVLGCDLLYRTGAFFDADGDWMTRHFGLPARARLEMAMMRCGPETNLELVAWHVPGTTPAPQVAGGGGEDPRQDDARRDHAAHLALYVDDVARAAAYLAAERGVRVLGVPTTVTGEPNEGTEFVFVRLPWGMHLELVRWPPLMPYCATTAARLHPPRGPWRVERPPAEE
jgi:catechol 2,3-dioxygenase-like lactoylglutathione lyase family enzyme